MATYRYVANDILSDLKQLYDDAQVEIASVVYWMHVVGDYYKRIRIERYSAYQYLNRLSVDSSVLKTEGMDKYLDLPNIYDYALDKGVDYVEATIDAKLVRLWRTTVSQLGRIRLTKEEAPSLTHRLFYIEGHRLYLIPSDGITHLSLGLYTSFDTTKAISLDDEFEFPQDLIPRLKADLLNMGRLVLSMPSNAVNDGTPEPTQAPSLPNQPVTAPQDEARQQQ